VVKSIYNLQKMKTNQEGFAASTAIIIILAVALLGAVAYIYMNQTAGKNSVSTTNQEVVKSETVGRANPSEEKNISEPDKLAGYKDQPGTDDAADWLTYRNEKCGYEINYPADYSPKEYDGDVSFIASDTAKCREQGGATETMCDEMNAGPYIGCGLAADFLGGAKSLQEYIAQGMEDHSISPDFSPKPVTVGGLSGTEVEGSGAAGAYKDIYLQKGDYVVQFNVAKEGNTVGVKIYDQMLSTFKFIDK
jgi:cytoskeletal protein RodZ